MAARIEYLPNHTAILAFRYNRKAVEALKNEIPPDRREFDPVQRCWTIQAPYIGVARSILYESFRFVLLQKRTAT